MPPSMPCPSIRIPVEQLSQSTFSQFGTVIENPAHSNALASQRPPLPDTESANQGTALKFLNVTHLSNLYNLAPSKKPSRPVVNMFVCAPRDLRPHEPSVSLPSSWGDIVLDDDDDDEAGGNRDRELFDVQILERHPFTTQTFIPMGLSQHERHTQYLVIVAPTLPAAASRRHTGRPPPYPAPEARKRKTPIKDTFAKARPSPFTNEAAPPPSQSTKLHSSQRPKGPGLPDLKNLRAFVATGNQAVTYGPGTWHAPMVVLGQRPIDFVVVQYANGVGIEDCQEILLKPDKGAEEGVVVLVDSDASGKVLVKTGLGAVKAKL